VISILKSTLHSQFSISLLYITQGRSLIRGVSLEYFQLWCEHKIIRACMFRYIFQIENLVQVNMANERVTYRDLAKIGYGCE